MNSTFDELLSGIQNNNGTVNQEFGVIPIYHGVKEEPDYGLTEFPDESYSLDSSSPFHSDHRAVQPLFPFTSEQLRDLEAVYAASPRLGFTDRDILADALDVTEDDVHLWFCNRRLYDCRLQPTHTSSPRSPFTQSPSSVTPPRITTPDEKTLLVRQTYPSISPVHDAGCSPQRASVCLLPAPPRVDSPSSATVTATYTWASHHSLRSLPYACTSNRVATSATTCHPAPVLTCRNTASLTMYMYSEGNRRPVGSSCLQVRSRIPGFSVRL